MPLTIEDYNRAEEEVAVGLSFSEIMAFSPETFNLVGFRPTSSATSSSHATRLEPRSGQSALFRAWYLLPRTECPDDLHPWRSGVDQPGLRPDGRHHRPGRAVRPVCNPLAQMGLFRSAGARRRL